MSQPQNEQKPAPAPQAPKATAVHPIVEVERNLNAMTGEFKKALPAHITPEKFLRIAITAIKTNPDIANCDKGSIYSSLMRCAQDGLLPDGREATITRYKDQARYSPMIAGLCKKARNSGEIMMIDALEVFSKDFYEAWTDETGPHFKHIKARGDRGEPVLTYAYAITKDGGLFFEEVEEAQILDIEKASAAKFGPWKGAFRGEMKRKSALRRLCKYRLPSNTDLDEVIRRDDDLFEFDREESAPKDVTPKKSRLEAMMQKALPTPEMSGLEIETAAVSVETVNEKQ